MVDMSKTKAFLAAGTASIAITASAQAATIIFEDSFERPEISNPRGWQIFQTGVGDNSSWTAIDGAGIEIQSSLEPSHSIAYDGLQYVELDSDSVNGGVPGVTTNSAMVTNIDFVAGQQYQISFAFKPRSTQFWESDGIALSALTYDATTGAVSNDLELFRVGRNTTTNVSDWVVYDIFYTATQDVNAIAFQAFGIAETLGGFIDSVKVAEVPIPAALPLFGAGIAGFAFATGRKKKTT